MYVIGEAGTWHAADGEQERMELAYELIETAASCGVNAVKFQCFTEGDLFCPMEGDERRWKHWRRTFLTEDQWCALKAYAEELGIDFILSAFQYETVDWCARMKLKWYKVASRAALTYPYDRAPGPFLISEGLAKPIMLRLFGEPPRVFIKLQCSMKYPTPLNEAVWVAAEDVGLSDHSGTPWPAIDALARGCPIVEVHFSMKGRSPWTSERINPDLKVSLSPLNLKFICEARDAFAEMRQE